jgi:ion channel-forming bestrophin family protein
MISAPFIYYINKRKIFVSISTEIRNCTRNIWVGVRESNDADRQEKEKYVKLLLAFAVSIKHHLRLEFGVDWYDLKDLLPEGLQLTTFDGNTAQENTDLGSGGVEDPNRQHEANRPSTGGGGTENVNNALRVLANRIPPSTYNTLRTSYSGDETTIWFGASEWGTDVDASMSLPLEIIFHISLYVDKKRSVMADSYFPISGALNTLGDIFGNLERIGNTPIPFAYNIHL